jgi:periplasmic divalent cation tolerance protein
MDKLSKYCIILTTCQNIEEAKNIASLLIQYHLAACVQITGITSFYEWNGKVNTDNEQLLIIKAKSDNYIEIENVIIQNHTYEVPEIVSIPITKGSARYLQWIDDVSSEQTVK